MPTLWSSLGIQRNPNTLPTLLKEMAAITAATNNRYVWRGLKSANYTLHTSLERRMRTSGILVSKYSLPFFDTQLINSARNSRLWPELPNAEMLALLQHAGAATSLLDVTPDPFVALFFATEAASSAESGSCALVALRVPGVGQDGQSRNTCRVPVPDELDPFNFNAYVSIRKAAVSFEPFGTPILWEAPYLDNRMRAQKGMFLATTAPTTPLNYGSYDLKLESPAREKAKIQHLMNVDRGHYTRPNAVVFYLTPHLRKEAADQLAIRFGYRTDTIYPDPTGFALANAHGRPLDPAGVDSLADRYRGRVRPLGLRHGDD